ncbi:MAG: NADH:flavin oxidoreductase [Actinomycetota bacterium]
MSCSLHRPITIGSVAIRNRLYRAPVLEGAGSDGDYAAVYREAFEPNARAGVGLIVQGSSCITEEGRSSPGMTLLTSRERVLRLDEVTRAVHAHGARIVMQIGHAGIFAMEGWHHPYADARRAPLVAASAPPVHVRPALLGVPLHVPSTDEVRAMAEDFGRAAAWVREAGYDGVQVGSANAKLVHQFLSPYYNRRDDEFGGSVRNRARILEVIADAVRRHAGDDYMLSAKIPIDEHAPPLAPRISFDEGMELCRLAQEFGYHAITPVGLSVFPHGSLCRGAYPASIDDTASIRRRLDDALGGSRLRRAIVRWGYRRAARAFPFAPVWNRHIFAAAKRAVSIPVFAVGGIRTRAECLSILDAGEADMIGIGRPFYAEPSLPARLLMYDEASALCVSSNRCVPPQMLGLRAACYNPPVQRKRAEMERARD